MSSPGHAETRARLCVAVLRDALLETLISENKDQAQDWIARSLVLPWTDSAARLAATASDRQVAQHFAEDAPCLVATHQPGEHTEQVVSNARPSFLNHSYACSAEIGGDCWEAEDLLSFALPAMNAGLSLLAVQPVAEQARQSCILVLDQVMGMPLAGLNCPPRDHTWLD